MHHTGPISSIAAFDKYIATTGYDNKVMLWNADTHTAIARSLHDHLANHCEFSPDGTLLVSASSDYSARIWEIPSMRLRSVLIGHADDIDMARFSPDGQYVATCSLDRSIKIFSIDGECLKTFTGHTGDVLSVTWAPDGNSVISCGVDGTVKQWNTGTSLPHRAEECRHIDMGGVRTDTLIATKDHCIITGDDLGRIAIIRNGVPRFVRGHKAGIKRIVYDETQALLATLSYDKSIVIWKIKEDLDIEEIVRSTIPAIVWPRSGAFCGPCDIVFGTFGTTYATFNWVDQKWDIESVASDPSINAVAVVEGSVFSIGDAGTLLMDGIKLNELNSLCNFLLPFGSTLLTGGHLGRLFNARSGEILYEHHSPLNCGTTFRRNGTLHAAIGTYTGEALIFSLETNGQIAFVTSLKIYGNAIKGMVADESTLFSVCASSAVAWHDINHLQQIGIIEHAHDRIANGCCLVAGMGFASIGRDRKLRLWNNRGDHKHEAYDTPHPNSVKCISASPDGKTIMTGCYGGMLAAFDVDTRTWRSSSRPTASGISSLTYDIYNKRFLASSYDGCVFSV